LADDAEDPARHVRARRHAEPPDGRLRRRADRPGRHARVRDRLRRGGPRRAGALADRQRRSRDGHRLHRRRVHGRRARRRRPARRRGVGRARPGRGRQVPRGLGRGGHREDPGAGLHHRVHPEATPGHLRPEGALRRRLSPPMNASAPRIPFTVRLLRATPRAGWAALALFAALAWVALPVAHLVLPESHPLHVSAYTVGLLGKILCYRVVAVAMDLVWGYAGILSLGHGLFFALGGYAFGMYLMRQIGRDGSYGAELPDFMVFLDWKALPWYWSGSDSFLWTLFLAAAVPGIVAFVFGYFAFRSRIKGVYFSIITQALTYAAMLLFFRNETGFGGNNGFTDFKRILGFGITTPQTRIVLFALSAALLVATLVVGRYLVASRFGRVLAAIRDAESRVMFIGYDPLHYKLFVWTLSAVLCGLAGALYVPQVGIINPSEMSPANSIEVAVW